MISIIFKIILLLGLTIFIFFKYSNNEQLEIINKQIHNFITSKKNIRKSLITNDLDLPQHGISLVRDIMDTLQETRDKKTENEDDKEVYDYISNNLQALILPHASWHYSKQFQADGFSYLKPTNDQTVIIIGPSHDVNNNVCSLSNFDAYQIPYSTVEVDTELQYKMKQQMVFKQISEEQEQEEHSIELLLPFLKYIYNENNKKLKILPMYCNIDNPKTRQYYGQKLREYFNNPNYFIIVSSDFTHWGPQYGNNIVETQFTSPNAQVSAYDDMAMSEISFQDPVFFSKFIKKYNDQIQICGAAGIDILLNSIFYTPEKKFKTVFTKYNQSLIVQDPLKDNTFGLATGVVFQKIKE